ncbi:MAG: hypothetical protein PA3071 [uncultured Thiotrichaceae bacterium]|uniref:DUF58 domain-containing protein n=1 Tax=uncultured Thiotrichaceae bacterium TaxID=298394 RepID=A0A6S6TXY0_9GAMM|nr:MAG: hypothetical protein PA3071 [uncultured Thiotrichaceae bacterium]
MQAGDGLIYSSLKSLLKQRSMARLLQRGSKNVHARQSGHHLSTQKGRGMDFAESRLYQPGDDVRTMDWRVTAKTGKAHTKIFQEERERPVLLYVDCRPSMFFGTRGKYKSVVAAEIASLLTWKMWLDGDRVGGVVETVSEGIEMRPSRSMSGISRWLKHIADSTQNLLNNTDKKSSGLDFDGLRHIANSGSQIIIISDFQGYSETNRQQLLGLTRKAAVHLVSIADPFEQQLPDVSGLRVTDSLASLFIHPKQKNLAKKYQQAYQQRQQLLQKDARKVGAGLIEVLTNDEQNHVLMNISRGLR